MQLVQRAGEEAGVVCVRKIKERIRAGVGVREVRLALEVIIFHTRQKSGHEKDKKIWRQRRALTDPGPLGLRGGFVGLYLDVKVNFGVDSSYSVEVASRKVEPLKRR